MLDKEEKDKYLLSKIPVLYLSLVHFPTILYVSLLQGSIDVLGFGKINFLILNMLPCKLNF